VAQQQFAAAVASAASAAPAAPAPGEGDTKRGTALVAQKQRCGALRAPTQSLGTAEPRNDMTGRYRALAKVLEDGARRRR
jgi:hypothetical protein